MTNLEAVIGVLKDYPCQSSVQIKTLIYRMYGLSVSVHSVAAALRKLGTQAKISSSNCGNGRDVYWLTDSFLEELNKQK